MMISDNLRYSITYGFTSILKPGKSIPVVPSTATASDWPVRRTYCVCADSAKYISNVVSKRQNFVLILIGFG